MVDVHRAQARTRRSATRPAAPAAFCSPRTTTSSSTTRTSTRDQKQHLQARRASAAGSSCDSTARLCAMNLLLHGIGTRQGRCPSSVDGRARGRSRRALRHGADQSAVRQEEQHHDRRRGGQGQRRETDIIERDDFWATTSQQAAQLRPARQDAAEASTAAPRWSCRTTCCSKAAPARPSAGSSCTSATCTRCCACPPACSTPRA